MKSHVRFAALGLLTIFGAAACATIAKGTTQTITVTSNVDGAQVYLEDEQLGTTPFTGAAPKNKSELRVEAPGYRTETVSLSKTLEPMFWGNIIIGGTFGSTTDFATGAAYQYAPATYHVELRRGGQDDAAFQEQMVVRKFAMLYVNEIANEAAAGGGEHLTALVRLLNHTRDRGVTAHHVTDQLRRARGDIPAFGTGIVGLL